MGKLTISRILAVEELNYTGHRGGGYVELRTEWRRTAVVVVVVEERRLKREREKKAVCWGEETARAACGEERSVWAACGWSNLLFWELLHH